MQYVIVEVVVRVVPARRFDAMERMVPTDELTASLDTFNKNYEFWRVNWISSIEQCLLWTVSPAQGASADKPYGDTATDTMKYLSKLLHYGRTEVSDIAQKALYSSMQWVGYTKPTYYHGDFAAMIPRDQHETMTVVQAEWTFRRTDVL